MSVVKTVALKAAQADLARLVDEAWENRTKFIIECNGTAKALLINVEELIEQMTDRNGAISLLEALNDPNEEWLDYDAYRRERRGQIQN